MIAHPLGTQEPLQEVRQSYRKIYNWESCRSCYRKKSTGNPIEGPFGKSCRSPIESYRDIVILLQGNAIGSPMGRSYRELLIGNPIESYKKSYRKSDFPYSDSYGITHRISFAIFTPEIGSL